MILFLSPKKKFLVLYIKGSCNRFAKTRGFFVMRSDGRELAHGSVRRNAPAASMWNSLMTNGSQTKRENMAMATET